MFHPIRWSESSFVKFYILLPTYLGDGPRLVVPPNELYAFWVSEFQAGQERYRLDGVQTPVHVVAKEEVVCARSETTNAEYLDQIMKLSVDITDDSDRGGDVNDIALPHEHLLGLLAYFAEERLAEELLVEQPFDAGVEVERGHKRIGDVLSFGEQLLVQQWLHLELDIQAQITA